MEPRQPTSSPVVCRTCGAENRPNRLFCASCGAYLQSEEEDTWENLPAPQAPDDVEPPSFLRTSPPAAADAWGTATWGPPPDKPSPAPRRRGRNTALGVLLALLLIAAAVATAVVVYVTFFEGGDGGEVVLTTTTAAAPSTTTTAAGEGSTTTQTTSPPPELGELVVAVGARASSALVPEGANTYEAANLLDGDLGTCWSEGVEGFGEGEWARLELAEPTILTAIEVANGYQKDSRRFEGNPRVQRLSVEYSDGTAQVVQLYDDMDFQIVTPPPKATEWVRLRIEAVYPGDTWKDTSLSEVRLYR